MSITVTPVLVADLGVGGERMPVYAHVIHHPDARVLVDTGIREPHPMTVDLDPRPRPPDEWGIDLTSIDIVVNTHLHFSTTAATTICSPAHRSTCSVRNSTTR